MKTTLLCLSVLLLIPGVTPRALLAASIPPSEGQYETSYHHCGAVLKVNRAKPRQIRLTFTDNPRGSRCDQKDKVVIASCPDKRLVYCKLSNDLFVPGRADCEAIFLAKKDGFLIFCPDRADGTDALNIPYDFTQKNSGPHLFSGF